MRPIIFFMISSAAFGSDEKVEVKGTRYSWLETAQTASEGRVDQEQLKERPVLRPGEILESVPGLITTQHSGTGKANQYFLRGFNLDHGTDFATFVDGIPINMPSHGHGQGYTDVNFLVPEIIERIDYTKGPYNAAYGDFSSAGHIDLKTMDVFPHGLVKYTGGSYDYNRLLILDSVNVGENQTLSYAVEGTRYKGPWSDIHENLKKHLGLLKYIIPTLDGQHTLSVQHYDGAWNSADQIPQRAVDAGIIDRLGTIDRSTGGKTRRDSASWIWDKKLAGDSALRFQLYGVDYGLNLWSDPSYFLEDPINGDQFEQEDRRTILGGSATYSRNWNMGSIPGTLRVGVQERYDDVRRLGLYATIDRDRTEIKGRSAVKESQTGVFAEQEWHWTSDFRSTLGVRHDQAQFETENQLTDEKADKTAQLTSPKLTLSYRLLPGWQIFASGGQSFHSNDGRGVTAKESPAPAFVPARGYEVGSSFESNDKLRVSIAAWRLQLDSELLYIGDTGTTEASRGSRREGVDWLLQIAPDPLFHADVELSWAHAAFTSDPDGEGKEVEGHLPFVAMLGFGSQLNKEWAISARLRHFGERPLTADGSEKSKATSLINLHAAYETGDWEFAADMLNALNSKDHDIDYFYESQLQGETEPVEDRHFHPVEPSTVRVSVGRRF